MLLDDLRSRNGLVPSAAMVRGTGFQLKQVSYQMGPLQECSGIYGSFDDHASIYRMHEQALGCKHFLKKQGERLQNEGSKTAFKPVAEADVAFFRPLAESAEPRFSELEITEGRDVTDAAIKTAAEREKRWREQWRRGWGISEELDGYRLRNSL